MPKIPRPTLSLFDTITGPPKTVEKEHLIIIARAGTGKTTTLLEGLNVFKGITPKIIPSVQQSAIWQEMLRSANADSIGFTSVGRAIVDDVKGKAPPGVDVKTFHQIGLKAVTQNFDLLPGKEGVDKFKYKNLLYAMGELASVTDELIGLCKATLTDATKEQELWDLCDLFGISVDDRDAPLVFRTVYEMLERSKDVKRDRVIDYNDMIWLPTVLDLPLFKYDLLIVDEAQDMNKAQQTLALRSARRLIICGDPRQSIFAFAGADSDSMPYLSRFLGESSAGRHTLPLTVSRRCGRAIVEHAKKFVSDFEAHEDNGEGKITEMTFDSYRQVAVPGDRVLCRNNAPLINEAFKFIRDGQKVTVLGRDIGAGLIKLVKKIDGMSGFPGPPSMILFGQKLGKWSYNGLQVELQKKNPSDNIIQGINDRRTCIELFMKNADSVKNMIGKIEAMFSDNEGDGILLSTIHKAKGLEANTVFLLMPESARLPSGRATNRLQRDQEENLLYVAITRARKILCYVK